MNDERSEAHDPIGGPVTRWGGIALACLLLALRSGSPEGAVTANPGSLYLRTTTTPRLWVKQSGTGSSGWVEK